MSDHGQFTVLLVEDDLNDIFLVKRAFKKADVPNPLQVVTDGVEAINYLQGTGKYADRTNDAKKSGNVCAQAKGRLLKVEGKNCPECGEGCEQSGLYGGSLTQTGFFPP